MSQSQRNILLPAHAINNIILVCVHRTECRARARVVLQRPPKTVSETINTRTRVYYLTKRACTTVRYTLFTFF